MVHCYSAAAVSCCILFDFCRCSPSCSRQLLPLPPCAPSIYFVHVCLRDPFVGGESAMPLQTTVPPRHMLEGTEGTLANYNWHQKIKVRMCALFSIN